jgi:hypothetical protein
LADAVRATERNAEQKLKAGPEKEAADTKNQSLIFRAYWRANLTGAQRNQINSENPGESHQREAKPSDSSPAERSDRTVTRGVRAAQAIMGAAASPACSLPAMYQTNTGPVSEDGQFRATQ